MPNRPRFTSRIRFSLLTIVLVLGALGMALVFMPSSIAVTNVLAAWGFDGVTVSSTAGQSPVITGGSATADSGVLTAGSSFTGFHTSSLTVWSTPVGNGSA